jgi:hypothetical protein
VKPVTLYLPVGDPFQVVAGVGEFNATVAFEQDLHLQGVRMTMGFTSVFNDDTQAIDISRTATASCPSDSDCLSYYFPGGLQFTLSKLALTSNDQLDVLTIRDAPGLHVGFWEISPKEQPLTTNDCTLLGNVVFSLLFCIRNSTVTENAIIAGTDPPFL